MEDIELCFLFQYLYVTVETKWEDGTGEASGQELNLEEPIDKKKLMFCCKHLFIS